MKPNLQFGLPVSRASRFITTAVLGVLGGYLLTIVGFGVPPRDIRKEVEISFKLRGRQEPQRKIEIVCLDDATVRSAGGRIPIPRRMLAGVINRVAADKPCAIALYLVLSGDSSFGIGDDKAMVAACREAGCVVLSAGYAEGVGGGRDSVIVPAARISSASRAVGLVSLGVDGGVARTAPLRKLIGGKDWPSLALEVGRLVTAWGSAPASGEVSDIRSPKEMLINYIGPTGTFPRVSALDVLEGSVRRGRFTGAIVLIGPTAAKWGDSYRIPRGIGPGGGYPRQTGMDGVEVQANVIHTVVTGKLIRLAPYPVLVLRNLAVAFLIAFIMAYNARGVTGVLLSLGVGLLSLLSARYVFLRWNYVLEETIASWCALATIGIGSSLRVFAGRDGVADR